MYHRTDTQPYFVLRPAACSSPSTFTSSNMIMCTSYRRSVATFFLSVILSALLFVAPALAQSATVQGTVTDATDGSALPGANVVAFDESGLMVTGAATSADGAYSFSVEAGSYTLRARFVGYQEIERDVDVSTGETLTVDFELSQAGLELNTVVVAASRRQEKALDAPASISILNTEDIETHVGASSVDALRTTTAVDIQQTGVDRRELVIRGFNNAFSGATYVLTDYRQSAVPSLGVNIYSIMPNMNVDVDRVEVVRGPGSALYGAGVDAGVVHFVTKDPFTHPGTTITLAGGERSLFAGQFRHAGTAGVDNKLGYKITGMYAQADDWQLDPNSQDSVFISQDGLQRNQDYDKYNLNGALEYRFSDEGSVVLNGGFSGLNATVLSGIGTLQAADFGYTYGQLRFLLKDFFAQVYFNKNKAGDSFVYGQDFDQDGVSDPVVDNSTQFVGQAQYDLSLWNGRQNLIFGGDLELTRPDTEGTILGRNEDSDDIDEYGGYVQSTTELHEKIDLTVALRGDFNSVVDQFQISPRAALVVKPTTSHSFRATYNRAFSSPGTNSNFLDIVAQRVSGITVRARGAASGFEWQRDPSLAAVYGTDLVASSLNPNSLGAPQGVGLPLQPTYTSVYAGLQAMPTSQVTAILNANNIPVDDATTAQLIQLLNPQLTQVDGISGGLMSIANLSGGANKFVTDLADIEPLDQTITQTFEVGYKGLYSQKFLFTLDAYYTQRKDFVGPLQMETPVVLVPNLAADLGAALTDGIAGNAQLAGALQSFGVSPEAAAGLIVDLASEGLPSSSTPVAIVQPIENNPGIGQTPELMLSYRNFGNVDFWGLDTSFQYIHDESLSIFGNASVVSDDFFDAEELEEEGTNLALALNAPTFKGRLGFDYSFPTGLSLNAAGRYSEEFPIRSGPYEGVLDSYLLLDIGAGYDLDGYAPGLRLDVGVSNVLDNEHREFIGAPQIGRMAMARLSYTVR